MDLVLLAAEQDTVPRRPGLLTLPAQTNQPWFTGNIPVTNLAGYRALVLGWIWGCIAHIKQLTRDGADIN